MAKVNLPRLTVITKQNKLLNHQLHLSHIIELENREVISSSWPPWLSLWSYVNGFQDLVRRFSKPNIFGTATEKERGRHIYVLMHGHALFLKHPDKLFEAKLSTYFFLICSIFRGFRDSLCVSQLT